MITKHVPSACCFKTGSLVPFSVTMFLSCLDNSPQKITNWVCGRMQILSKYSRRPSIDGSDPLKFVKFFEITIGFVFVQSLQICLPVWFLVTICYISDPGANCKNSFYMFTWSSGQIGVFQIIVWGNCLWMLNLSFWSSCSSSFLFC